MLWKKILVLSCLLLGDALFASEKLEIRGMPSAYKIAWSTNGQTCLVKVGVEHYEAYNTEEKIIWSRTMQANNVILSPDGTQVAYVLIGDGLYVYTFDTKQERKILNTKGTENAIVQLTWSPSGEKLAYWLFPKNAMTEARGNLQFLDPNSSH